MGIATFPASSGGLTSAIKSIQRGTAASAGNITISAVVVAKTVCNSFSTGSAGAVAATGTISAATGATSTATTSAAGLGGQGASSPGKGFQNTIVSFYVQNRYQSIPNYGFGYVSDLPAFTIGARNISLNATNLSGGSTSLTSAVYGIHLVDSTTITATGPCRYEVIEYF
jgi:hypothetical protein